MFPTVYYIDEEANEVAQAELIARAQTLWHCLKILT